MCHFVVLQVVHDANGTNVSDLTYVDVNTPQVQKMHRQYYRQLVLTT